MVQEPPFVGIREVRPEDGERQKRNAAVGLDVRLGTIFGYIPLDLNDRPQDSGGGTGDFILRNSL